MNPVDAPKPDKLTTTMRQIAALYRHDADNALASARECASYGNHFRAMVLRHKATTMLKHAEEIEARYCDAQPILPF